MEEIGRCDFNVKMGDSIRRRFRWMRLTDAGERVVIPLTGRTFAATARPASGEPVNFIIGDTELDLGYVTVSMSAANRRALGEWAEWDMQQTVGDDVTTVLEGVIRGSSDVTP